MNTKGENVPRGTCIVIEGMDGSGKGTQIRLLQEKVAALVLNVLFTREPGGTPAAETIRELILQKNGPAKNPLCDLFLFLAARASHVEDVIAPALIQGQHVISDRYDASTLAYQIFGENQRDLELMFWTTRQQFCKLNALYMPTAYIVLDLPPEVAYARRQHDASQAHTRFDVQPLEFHQRVRDGYYAFRDRLAQSESNKRVPVHIVGAERSPQDIHEDIWRILEPLLTAAR